MFQPAPLEEPGEKARGEEDEGGDDDSPFSTAERKDSENSPPFHGTGAAAAGAGLRAAAASRPRMEVTVLQEGPALHLHQEPTPTRQHILPLYPGPMTRAQSRQLIGRPGGGFLSVQ